ncbi:MAG: nucleotidyltransferase domain-containing protein [Patescibacteria group bacterium]
MDAIIPEEIRQQLTNLGVGVLYLYGSRAQGTAHAGSDYDIGVVFDDPQKADFDLDRYSALYGTLNAIFPDNIRGPKLDIAFLQRANAKLQLDAVQYGRAVFESNPRVRADYEESVIKHYDDYRFLEREYEDATFGAFSKA